jgi:5-methylcytosine-specific restriction endonuclease McrA
MKTCANCGEKKPLTAFGVHRARKGGVRSICLLCNNSAARKWYHANRDKAAETAKRCKAAKPEQYRNMRRKTYPKNRERWAAAARVHSKKPARRAYLTAQWARRHALELKATPAWLSAIQLAQIQEFYEVAVARTTQTGVPHHVDHIHPLQGANFRGLHVPWNLQVLTAEENVRKGNRLQPLDAQP